MKKYKILFLFLSGVLVINSCNTNDLELSDPNQITPETYFSNETQVQAAVNAAYANLQPGALYGRLMWFMNDNMSQEAVNGGGMEPNKEVFLNFSFNSTNGFIRDYWDACYRGINKANFVIGNAPIIDAIPETELSNATKLKFYAEARFLRAQYYWLLVTKFGNIPLLKNGDFTESLGKEISPKADVVAQIIEDLEYASIYLLPKASEDTGRATKGAAQAFLGKVLLYEKRYGDALTSFEKMSGYDLEANFLDNFLEETENGIESVWEVQYDLTLGTSNKWGSDGTGQNHATFRGQDYGALDWFGSAPSDDLVNSFETGDERLNDTFYFAGDIYNNGTSTFKAADFPVGRGWRKYQNYYKQPSEVQESGINAKVIRYADVLLMMAECANEVRTQSEAIGLINRVRARAGATAGGTFALLSTTLSKAQVFEAIVQERKVELAGEQVRFDDLVRWDRAATFLAGTGFQAGKNELFPIPEGEISSNPNVTSADQNPGY
ncbi:RagB/SusD domain-containing protein [Cellulophaga algicola DSM 14237]|uniref:RagB/SusD domain-containing protein n=1 Tax=Cellulophaga algicola (strain DSM 14237 / IC166 / ACAM 630) TaxID=688270 RepID=E6X3N5_CELAD|nr:MULTISPECIES: RagB/SusD family nutrient uptake outer membrane protein [Cellulophaga]ADV48188.1 RagB/SusD domain-containing protein [Cellulophaga algicola DSM 14237]